MECRGVSTHTHLPDKVQTAYSYRKIILRTIKSIETRTRNINPINKIAFFFIFAQ